LPTGPNKHMLINRQNILFFAPPPPPPTHNTWFIYGTVPGHDGAVLLRFGEEDEKELEEERGVGAEEEQQEEEEWQESMDE
jgi:hypothetical protein